MFANNLEYIRKHNEETKKGIHNFTLGVKRYADLTHDEWHLIKFQKKYSPYESSHDDFLSNVVSNAKHGRPDSVDWRKSVSW